MRLIRSQIELDLKISLTFQFRRFIVFMVYPETKIPYRGETVNKPILCAGEILLDLISTDAGKDLADTALFEKKPGGSIFNVTVGLKRLGADVSFLTKIGTDEFGKGLYRLIIDEKIGTECVLQGSGLKTTLAFAAVDKEGKPEFRFYRDHAADTRMTVEEIADLSPINYSIFHFGSISLLEGSSVDVYLEAFARFKKHGTITSLDPNIRPTLIKDRKAYLDMIFNVASSVSIIKMSDDDLRYLSGLDDLREGIKRLPAKPETLIFITLGPDGAAVRFQGEYIEVPGFKVKVKETTGCGDAFMAGILYQLWKLEDLSQLNKERLKSVLTFANKVAAIVATGYGAANSMPILEEVNSVHF